MALRSNMAECESKPITKKTYIIQTVSVAIAFAVKALIAYYFDAPTIGWFFFGLISSVGVLFAYREKGDRFTTVNIIFMTIVSIIMAGMYYLFSV